MLKSEIQIGGRYIAKVANNLTTVRITAINHYGGWNAVNEKTQRDVRIKTAAKLRGPATPKQAPVTNGNGERMMTENQRAFIDTLLSEKVVSDSLVNRYNVAVIENRVTLAAADTFIKHMIGCPRKPETLTVTRGNRKMTPQEAGAAFMKSVAKQAAQTQSSLDEALTLDLPDSTRPVTYTVTLTGEQLDTLQEVLDSADREDDQFIGVRVAVDSATKSK